MRFFSLLWRKCSPILQVSFVRSTSIYIGSSFLNAIVPFLMMPVLTRFLTPSDYGIVAMFTMLVGFVAPFTGLSVHGAVYRQYFELQRSEMKIYIGNSLGILLCSTSISAMVVFVFSSKIVDLTNIPMSWIWAILLVSMSHFVCNILLAIWQVQVKPLWFGLFQNMRTLVNIVLSLVFVVGCNLSWQGRLWGIVITAVASGMIAFYLLNSLGWLQLEYNKNYVKNALSFGIPMIPTSLKDSMMAIVDKLFITNMIDLGATGLYSLGFQLSMALSLLTSSFNSAYVPWLFKKLKQDNIDTNKAIVRLTYAYFLTIVLIALIWTFLAGGILRFFAGPGFSGAKPFILWLSLGFAFSGMHSMVVNYIYFAQKTALYGLVSLMSVFLNIALNYFLITENGSIGAAQATCITYLLTFLMTWKLSSRVHPMPWFYFLKGESS